MKRSNSGEISSTSKFLGVSGSAMETNAKDGGPSEGVGFRGALLGSTGQNVGYETHFHEIQELHSRKIKSYVFNWGLQRTKFANNGNAPGFALLPVVSGSVSPAHVIPGVVGLQNTQVDLSPSQIFSPMIQTDRGRQPDGTTQEIGSAQNNTAIYARDLADYVYTNPINLVLEDFVDNKLWNFDNASPRGIMTQYRKFRLKKFSVEYEFHSFDTGVNYLNLGELNGGWVQDSVAQTTGSFNNRTQHMKMDYYLYRDIYTDFATTTDFDVPAMPIESQNASNPKDQFSRAVKDVRNLDNQLTIVKNGEKFKFERLVNAKGSYFLTLAQVNTLRDSNIAYLIAALEAGNTDPLSVTSPFPEGFSVIFAPVNPPIQVINETASCWDGTTNSTKVKPVHVGLTTKVWVRFLATWEAFDFNYGLAGLELVLTETELLSLQTMRDNIHRALIKGRKQLL